MSKKRVAGLALLVMGGLGCLFGVEGLEKSLTSPGGGTELLPFEGIAILLGLVMMVAGGLLFARSFLDL